MKLQLKHSFQIPLAIGILLLASCGKKENKINSSSFPQNNSSNPLFTGSIGATILSQISSIHTSVACLPGRTRLANDVNFYINSTSNSGTTITGNWQPGLMPINNGTVSNLYVGVGAYRDLMFLTKVTNGSQVLGYNVTLSFCDMPNAYPNFPPLISNDRALVNFQAPNGITINTATSCGYGLIAAAINTIVISQRSTTNPYTSDFPIYTSFAKPTCQ